MIATQEYTLPSWARALAIVVGVIAIIIAIVFFIYPGIALALFVFLAGVFLLAFGIERIAAGASGHAVRFAPMPASRPATPTPPGNPPPP
jgi:uncharacterized membrane protein HdeD (DUF308 family)